MPRPMEKWYNYSVSSNNIWASWDFGYVKAESIDEALELAKKQLDYDFQKVNDVLNHADVTLGWTVEYSGEIEIELVTDPSDIKRLQKEFDEYGKV